MNTQHDTNSGINLSRAGTLGLVFGAAAGILTTPTTGLVVGTVAAASLVYVGIAKKILSALTPNSRLAAQHSAPVMQ